MNIVIFSNEELTKMNKNIIIVDKREKKTQGLKRNE